jgi:Ca-activated chloride channel family protein
VSFTAPLVLLGLLVLPALAILYVVEQRRAARAAGAFATLALTASVAPRRPGLRRHIPFVIIGLGLALGIIAAARPRVRVTVAVKAATVMLVNDVSNSMTATDVSPSRLAAAQQAAVAFTTKVSDAIAIGSISFARRPMLLQSPNTDHSLAREAVTKLTPGGGGTAIGEAIETALIAIQSQPKIDGKRPPGAIVLLSDGTSNVGVGPGAAAAMAKKQKVKIDTIAIGTTHGTEREKTKDGTKTVPVPVNPSELEQIASDTGGTFSRAPDEARVSAIYASLATQIGHRKARRGLVSEFAAGALALLVIGGGLSLYWFGRLT